MPLRMFRQTTRVALNPTSAALNPPPAALNPPPAALNAPPAALNALRAPSLGVLDWVKVVSSPSSLSQSRYMSHRAASMRPHLPSASRYAPLSSRWLIRTCQGGGRVRSTDPLGEQPVGQVSSQSPRSDG
eukprot:1179749-Prorocentrum_minimum.AAC.2